MSEDKNSEVKYVMVASDPSTQDDEIDLIELMRSLFRAWKTIALITISCVVFASVYAILSPEVYRAETLLSPVQGKNSGESSALGQLGGLATMMGAQIPHDSNVERVIATLESRKFLGLFIKNKNLMPILFEQNWDKSKKAWLIDPPPSEQSAIRTLKRSVSLDEDKSSGLITLSVNWENPQFCSTLANDIVKEVNSQLRLQAITDSEKRIGFLERELAKTTLQDMRAVLYKLLESEKQKAMLANVNEDFALEVIDPAVEPTRPSEPNRKLIVVVGGLCGGITGVFTVFFLHFYQKLKTSLSTTKSINV